MSENYDDGNNIEKEEKSPKDKKSKKIEKIKEELHKVFNSKNLDSFSINTEDKTKDIQDTLLQQSYFIQLLEDLKSTSPEFLPPGTLYASLGKYDYCLFNLVGSGKTGSGGVGGPTGGGIEGGGGGPGDGLKSFCLNDFFDYIETIKNDRQKNLIEFILSMYCNNFVEFREFYHNKIDESLIDYKKIHTLEGDELNLYDIRCGLAHDVSFNKDKKSGKWLIHIKVDNKNGHKEADIEPSFFDETLNLPSTCSHLDFDAIEQGKKGKINYYTFQHKGISDSNKAINSMTSDSRFKQTQSTKFFNEKYYKKIKKNDVEIKNMKDLIKSQNLEVSGYTLGLVSDTNRPYVHNLLSMIAINVYYQMLKNPSIPYKDLVNITVESLSNHLFTIQDTENIITLCLDNLNNRIKVQTLKTYYINIFKDKLGKDGYLSSKKRKNETKEFLTRTGSNKIGEDYNEYINEMHHIRNALAHGRYFVIGDCIKMWDINEKGKVVRGSTMDGKFKNKENDKNEGVFSIKSLHTKTLKQELKFESKGNRTIIETSNKLRKNIL